MAGKIPGPENISIGRISPSGPVAPVDLSGLVEGVRQLGRGAGAVLHSMQDRQNTVDIAKAEAIKTQGFLDTSRSFSNDPDYQTFGTRVEPLSQKIITDAANAISDPTMREKWLAQSQVDAVKFNGSVVSMGDERAKGAQKLGLATALGTNAQMISEPTVDEGTRRKAQDDIRASILTAVNTGVLTGAEGAEFSRVYLEKAQEQLAANRADVAMRADPVKVMHDMGIGQAVSPTDVYTAASAANGSPLKIAPDLARIVADTTGDRNFPSDPKLVDAYLSDPKKAEEYAQAASDMLIKRYKGDVTAAVIAAAPDGGTELADKWVASNHDEGTLPAGVRNFMRSTMTKMTSAASLVPIPIEAEPGVDLTNVKTDVLTKWEQTQTVFGKQLTILSGYRDPEHNAAVGGATHSQHMDRDAIDISTKGMSHDDVNRLIATASAQGFSGVGVYPNSIHLDTGARRAWGPSYHSDSVPAWAADTINAHVQGQIQTAPMNVTGVAPEYRALTYDQRQQLYDSARVKRDQLDSALQGDIAVAAENAPAAIAATGKYDGTLPQAIDFVKAYGADKGMSNYQTFQAAVDVANKQFELATMPGDQIAQMLVDSKPTSSSDTAGVESDAYQKLATAAAAVNKAREDDPAGYVMSHFPNVADAWKAAGDDPTKFSAALQQMANAQARLGIKNVELLPKDVAKSAADAFKDDTLPQTQRVGAAASLMLHTADEGQQKAIVTQLLNAGVPSSSQGAFAALQRGDAGAATTLFRAIMADPDKTAGAGPLDAGGLSSDKDLKSKIQDAVFDNGKVGDVVYNLTGGAAENFNRVTDDSTLMLAAVKMRLLDGSANGNVDKAIQLTIADMYGKVKVVTGSSDGAAVKVTLPQDADEAQARKGFAAVLPQVGEALHADLTSALPGGQAPDASTAIEPGNIDLFNRPVHREPDGTIETVRSISIEEDGKEVLIPTVSPDGKMLTNAEATALYQKTGQHLGKFASVDAADAYAQDLHVQQEQFYGGIANSMRPIMQRAVSNYGAAVLAEGYFANGPDGSYVFMNPKIGRPITKPDGTPLTFSLDDVLNAGQQGAAPAAPSPDTSVSIGHVR